MIDSIALAFRSATRRLRRQPAFVILTAGSIALAQGMTTASFGFADAWMNPAVAYEDPDHTFTLQAFPGPLPGAGVIPWEERTAAALALPAFRRRAAMHATWGTLAMGQASERTLLFATTANFFEILGVRPRLGRTFSEGGADANAIVVGDAFWRRHFNNRSSIGDARVTFDDRTYTVIGVMPRGMTYGGPYYTDLWRIGTPAESRNAWRYVIRVPAGTTLESGRAELAALTAVQNARNADATRPYGYWINYGSLQPENKLSAIHYTMIAVAVFVLLIACANVSAMLLTRAAARRRDLALRLSLGAARGTIILDIVAELAIVALVGTAGGLVVAHWASVLVRFIMPIELTWSMFVELTWSWRIFALSAATLVSVVALAGALPAIQVSRIAPIDPLKESSAGSTGRTPQRMKSVVMLQLAVSLVMLIATALMVRQARDLSATDFGMNPRRVLAGAGRFVYRDGLSAIGNQDPAQYMMERAEATAGVVSVSSFEYGSPIGSQITSDDVGRDGVPLMALQYVIAGPRFFETLQVPLVEGRDFMPGDDVSGGSIILEDSAARMLFPTSSAVGRRVRLGSANSNEPWRRVVGVVRTARPALPGLAQAPRRTWPLVYASIPRPDPRRWGFIARAESDSTARAAARQIRSALDVVLPINVYWSVSVMSADHDSAIRARRQLTSLFGTLALGALAFASAGLFAVLSFMVSQRMREFGIRVAIGAQRTDVLRLVMRDGLELALGGSAIGGALGVAAAALAAPALFTVDGIGVLALLSAELTLIAVTLLAALAPALRATRANPVDVLRAV